MPIIKPRGLLGGDRLGKLSDEARLYWPFMYAGSNGHGRFEISYAKILHKCFAQFHAKPLQETIKSILHEYRDQNLLFMYEANGRLWAAWDSTAKQDYYSAEDDRSPAPPEPAFGEWKKEYRAKRDAQADSQYEDLLGQEFRQKIQNSAGIDKDLGRKSEIPPPPPLTSVLEHQSSVEHQALRTSKHPNAVVEISTSAIPATPSPPDPEFDLRLAQCRLVGKMLTKSLHALLRNDILWHGWLTFWADYPNQIAYPEAFRAYWQLCELEEITPKTVPKLLAGEKRYNNSELWQRDNGRFICKASVFLIGDGERRRGRMWLDSPRESEEAKAEKRAHKRSASGTDSNAEWVPPWKQSDDRGAA